MPARHRVRRAPAQEIYRHVTVLEDVRFLVRHAAKLLPPDWRALDAAQLKADLYALRERMRRERAAAVDVRARARVGAAGSGGGGRRAAAAADTATRPTPTCPQALRQALRSFYADAEPADVDLAAAAVAKKFSVGVVRCGEGGGGRSARGCQTSRVALQLPSRCHGNRPAVSLLSVTPAPRPTPVCSAPARRGPEEAGGRRVRLLPCRAARH